MYEIIEWQGQQGNSLQVQYQQIPLESVFSTTADLSGIEGWDKTNIEGIDIIDVEFTKKVKASDRDAYLFAMISGIVAGMIDYTFVGKTDYKAILEKLKNSPEKLTQEQIGSILKIIASLNDFNLKKLDDFDKTLKQAFGKVGKAVNDAPKYKELVKDFASGMSIRSLVTNIVCRIIGYRAGLDENGAFTFVKIDDPEFDKLPIMKKIELAFTEWFFMQVDIYRNTKEFEGEVQGIFAFAKGINALKKAVEEIANLKLFRNGSLDGTKAYNWFKEKMLEDVSDDDELIDLKNVMIKQAVPVVINKALIRTYLFVEKFCTVLLEKNVKSIEGLAFINPAYMSDEEKKRCDLLEGFAGLIFETIDLAGAGIAAVKVAGATGVPAAGVIYAFATQVNFVNICNLVSICRRNKAEIKDAVKNRIPKEKYQKFVKDAELLRAENEKLIVDYLTLNQIETKILYSLELQMINEDINATRDSETQIKKNAWKQEWMNLSKEATGYGRLFYQSPEKLYAMINTRIGNENYNGWLHRIALEISLFVPYFPLKADDNTYKKLKYTNKKYVDDVFCTNQDMISTENLKNLRKTYKKYYDALEHKQEKTTAGAVGAVVVAAGAAVAAYTFAPVIAVALAGHMFTGIYGAALTNASLALFGGGALAAGGFGMAGGAMVIAGGGAILGLGVSSGMTSTALLLLSSSSYVQRDQAKMLTTIDFDLEHFIIYEEDIEKIANNLDTNIKSTKIRLSVLKSAAAQSKEYKKESAELIKELEKSIKLMENSKALVTKMTV